MPTLLAQDYLSVNFKPSVSLKFTVFPCHADLKIGGLSVSPQERPRRKRLSQA